MISVLRSVLLVVVPVASLLAPSAVAGAARVPTPQRLDGPDSGHLEQVVTSTGSTVSMWMRFDGGVQQVRAAVRRPGHDAWGAARTVASWRGKPSYEISLAAGGGGRVFATWVNGSGRLVMMRWDPAAGWGSRTLVPGAAKPVGSPTIAVNPVSGVRAVAFVHARPRSTGDSVLRVAVQREGRWTTLTVGPSGDHRIAGGAGSALVADDLGNLTVAWRLFSSEGDTKGYASRLAAGADAWEAPHDFGDQGEAADVSSDPVLLPRPDGTVDLFQASSPLGGPLEWWQRTDAEPWSDLGSVPGSDAGAVVDVLRNPRGDLAVVETDGSFVTRPAGGEWEVHHGPNGWTTGDAVLAADGRIAAVGRSYNRNTPVQVVFGSVDGPVGDAVAVGPARRQLQFGMALAPNGSASVLWVDRRPPGDPTLRGAVVQLPK